MIGEDKVCNAKLFSGRYYLLQHCKQFLPVNPIAAEVGVAEGFFSKIIMEMISPSKIYLIDYYQHNSPHNEYDHNNHYKYILNKFNDIKEVSIMKGLSWDCLQQLSSDSLDYIYIDGDHSYESVKKDITGAMRVIKNGGILHFNDYTTFSPIENIKYGVLHAVNQLLETNLHSVLGVSFDRNGYGDIAIKINKDKKDKMLTIITPSCRQELLSKIKESIEFEKIDKWIIVYDTSKDRSYNKIFNHPKILETFCDHSGVVGHPQRNYGLSLVENGHIYFLDDDNIIHPNFWSIVDKLNGNFFYTFNQLRNKYGNVLKGDNVSVNNIDTAMFIVHKKHIKDIKWHEDRYNADGYFISDIFKANPESHKYINEIACYYNFLV